MRSDEFSRLCKYCDNIILSNINSELTLSYSKLHVIKNHPEFNNEYLLEKNIKKKPKNLKTNFYFGILRFLKNFFYEEKNFYYKRKKEKKIQCLVISSLIHLKHLNLDEDFYYGSLLKQLKKKNISSKLILRNDTIFTSREVYKKLKKNKIILSKRTQILYEIFFIILAFCTYLKFNLFIEKFYYKKKKINFFSLRSFGYIISNLRQSIQIERLVKIFKPKFVIITFEGHAWERLIIKRLKKFKNLKIFAYQFSAVTKNHHSLFRSINNGLDPDCILTTGNNTYSIFNKKYNCPIKIIGSKKSLKRNLSINLKRNAKKNKNSVLILPEAYISESKSLLNFAIKISEICKHYKFYLRLHPMIHFNQIDVDIKKYNNIEISNVSLEEDFKRTSVFIYRGSASSIEASAYGLIPVYYGPYNFANVNPLFQVLTRRSYITDPKKFENLVNSYSSKERKKIKLFSLDFFEKLKLNKNIFRSL